MFRLLFNKIAVQKIAEDAESNSTLVKKNGLYLHKEVLEANEPVAGVVVAAGPGRFAEKTGVLIPNQVKVGDKILFAKNVGTLQKIEDVEYLIMHDVDIICVFENV